ncbi:MAG: AI-2E family transporter [Candidatus Pacebacteria bacterium]|nr:AI-2E family transporter [Candidatus Paceibacterota bacterium]
MENKRLEIILFSAIFIVLSVLTFFVFKPFLGIIVLAAVLSVLFHPLNEWMVRSFRGNKTLVACILVVVAFVFLIVPIIFFGLQIFSQAQSYFSLNQADQGQYIQSIGQNANTIIQQFIPTFSLDIPSAVDSMKSFVTANIGNLLSQTAYVFFQTFFLLLAFFFFLRDGTKILDSIVSLSPFEKEQNKEIVHSTSRMIVSIIRGTLFIGLIRLILITATFYLLGIPNALLWGSLGGVIAMIPGLGTVFAIVPACLYLLYSGDIFAAIAMAVFGILVFFLIDNILSTRFFGKGMHIQPPFILFSILGGVIFFGPLGFIFGPIILSLFISMVNMYKILVLDKKQPS